MRAPLACLLLSACTGHLEMPPAPAGDAAAPDGSATMSEPPPDAGPGDAGTNDAGPGDSGWPDAAVPDAGEPMTLSVAGASFLAAGVPVDVHGAISCCGGGYGWPLFDEAWLAYTQGFGVNFLHARLGPFLTQNPNGETDWAPTGGGYVEVNGKADLSRFNPAFWDRLRQLLTEARAAGQWVELDVADGWAVKHCVAGDLPGYSAWDPGFNLQGEDACATAGNGPIAAGSTHERWVRQVVAVSGAFDDVLYQDGNELGLVPGYSPDWTRSIHDLIRDEEARHGYVTHPFGTNSGDPAAIALTGVDYVELHQKSPATLSQCANKPCLVNEYNPDPALTPDQFHQADCAARQNGTWFWYWRHGQTSAQMEQSLTLQAQGCP